jgi:hypothetical protein
LEDLQRALPFLAAVGAHQIEVIPVGGGFGPKVGRIAEGFPVKELVFHGAMHGFDVALPSVPFGRDVTVFAPQGTHGGGQPLLLLVF